jgi:DNA-binding transcriptional regulator YhcF (GntR family)
MKNTEDRGVAPKELATQLGVHYDIVRKRIRKLFPEIMKRGRTTSLNAEQVAAIKKRINREDGYLSIQELADQLGVHCCTIRRRMHELFPDFTPERRTTSLNAEQVAAIKKRINREDGYLSIQELADQLGVRSELIKKYIQELFPEFTLQGRTTWLNVEQVAAIKKQMVDTTIILGQPSNQLEQMTMAITPQQLSKRWGHSVKFITKCIHELFPGLKKPGIPTLLNAEQVALIQKDIKVKLMKKKLVYEKLIQALKSESCYTQGQIVKHLDLTEDKLLSILKGYKFVEYEPSDDKKNWVYWPKVGVYIKEPGILVKIPPKKARSGSCLLRYPQNETPLQQGIIREA